MILYPEYGLFAFPLSYIVSSLLLVFVLRLLREVITFSYLSKVKLVVGLFLMNYSVLLICDILIGDILSMYKLLYIFVLLAQYLVSLIILNKDVYTDVINFLKGFLQK